MRILVSRVLSLFFLALFFSSCSVDGRYTAITITPGSKVSVTAAGDKIQFRALGTYIKNAYHGEMEDVTDRVNWRSSDATIVTVDGSGMATAVGPGVARIDATMNTLSASVTFSVAGGNLTSVVIVPAAQGVTTTGETSQFIAIGTFTDNPVTQDLTSQATWLSSDVKVATVDSAGLATAVFDGATTITAIAKSPDGSTVTASANLTVGASGGVQLPTLAVYKVGLGGGTVVSSPIGIDCGSGSICTGHFVLNSAVTLTATPDAGSVFGGWSANCQPDTSATCSIVMSNNDSVGAIFNLAP